MQTHQKDTVISITSGTIIKIFAIMFGFWALWALRDLVLVVIMAVIIASSIEPMVNFLGNYHIPRVPAVLIIYVFTVGLFVGIFYAFAPLLITELTDFSEKLPSVAQELNLGAFRGNSGAIKKGEMFIAQVSEGASLQDLIFSFGKIFSTSKSFFVTAGSILGGFFSFILIIILSFYFAVQKNGIENFLKIVIPFDKETYFIGLWERSREKIGKWMKGQLLLGILIFVLVYLGLTIFGVPYAFLLAILAGVLEIIPVFGPIISAIPGIIFAFSSGGVSLAVVVAGFYLLVQQFESHLIYPLVVRKIVGIPPIMVILSLIIGFELIGFIGILISVPVMAVIMEIVEDIEKSKSVARA
ncbi:MAG: AI-2E family transporter [Candidatus Yonathbacteria bacterium]|nr:AI-2E family transporter [Candidatus Yonathbacteria bacterium]